MTRIAPSLETNLVLSEGIGIVSAAHAGTTVDSGRFPRVSRGKYFVRRQDLRPKLRLKPLKSYAHALCQMLIGWRMQDDLNRFARLPDGTITVDALAGTCTHSIDGELTTYIGPEIAAWLRHRLDSDGIPLSAITMAHVTADVHITTEQRRRDTRVKFDWQCRSLIATRDRQYTSELAEPHTWCSGNSRKEESGEPADARESPS